VRRSAATPPRNRSTALPGRKIPRFSKAYRGIHMKKLFKNKMVLIMIGLVVLAFCVALLSGVTVFQIKYSILILALFILTIIVLDIIS
jgi:hypothetical protein